MYPEELTTPMKNQLVEAGFKSLESTDAVDEQSIMKAQPYVSLTLFVVVPLVQCVLELFFQQSTIKYQIVW